MRIYIDDTQLPDAPDAPGAIDAARAHIDGSDRLIIDVMADGERAPEAVLDGTSDGAGIGELRFVTADAGAFLRETTHAAKDSIGLIRRDQETAATQIRTGELSNAMQTLGAVMEGWQAVRDVVDQGAQLAGVDPASLEVERDKSSDESGGETGAAVIEDLSAALGEIRDTLGAEDWASLGDVVEYDLATLTERWDALLDAMIERADPG